MYFFRRASGLVVLAGWRASGLAYACMGASALVSLDVLSEGAQRLEVEGLHRTPAIGTWMVMFTTVASLVSCVHADFCCTCDALVFFAGDVRRSTFKPGFCYLARTFVGVDIYAARCFVPMDACIQLELCFCACLVMYVQPLRVALSESQAHVAWNVHVRWYVRVCWCVVVMMLPHMLTSFFLQDVERWQVAEEGRGYCCVRAPR
jgi:hypothetical protein